MRRPNILLINTDQQRWDALGANGNGEILTPNLDRLASEGVNFRHFFVQNPVCMPSRVSFLSGQYCSSLRILQNGMPVPENTVTLPRLLRNYGYHSANIGKLHFLPHANRDHREVHPDYGFDQLEISDEPGCYEDAYRAWVRRVAPDQLDCLSVGLPPATAVWQKTMGVCDGIRHPAEREERRPVVFPGRDDVTHTAFVATRTIEYLRARAHDERPFLCLSGIYSPHSPWVAPRRFMDLYDPDGLTLPAFPPELDEKRYPGHFDDEELRGARQGYYAMVTEVDHHVGRMLEALEELGLADNTIVIFMSDHGEWLGDHLHYGKGYPAHDCISRVPLVMRLPGGPHLGTIAPIVEAVDLVPTLLEACAIPVPGHLQGRSFLPLLEGHGEASGRASALTEGDGWKTLRTDGFRYVARADGSEFLHDLRQELGEYRDVSGEPGYAAELSEHRRLLVTRMIELERPLPRTWAY